VDIIEEKDVKPAADFLIEVSWEVCNKVGGIYTVLMSKAARMLDYYDGKYLLIGPYFADKIAGNFVEEYPKEDVNKAFNELKKEGIYCHFGKWLIEGEPKVILIDFSRWINKVNEIKKWLWEGYKIDSIRAGYDYDEPVTWAYCAGRVIEKYNDCCTSKKTVAHFHEWLAGAGLLYLKSSNSNVKTVFMTHATNLGRTLASNNFDLYSNQEGSNKSVLEKIDPNKEAYNFQTEAKHMVEFASAQNADVFTTVSEITMIEAKYLLKREADILLPNGLDMEKFPTFEEASIKHKSLRRVMREFAMYYFFPHYTFDINETLYFFLAGRYEFRDKGIDVYIEALGKLNDMLKKENSEKTVIAFIWVPTQTYGVVPTLLENKTNFMDIKQNLTESEQDIESSILQAIISEKKISDKNILGDSLVMEFKKKILRMKKKGNPMMTTHYVDKNDIIMKALSDSKLNNTKEDRVKVVDYPIYLTGADGLLDTGYYESMQGCHLGVFPSYYEPWGYTPLEAGALGVSSVTTDLAGFGRFIMQMKQKKETPGIFVLKRQNKKDSEIIDDLAKFMYEFVKLSKHERVQNKIEAKRLSNECDWKSLIKNYIEAHNMAIKGKGR